MSLWSRLSDFVAGADDPRRVAEAAFPCDACSQTAATVTVIPRGVPHPLAADRSLGEAWVIVEGFSGTLSEVAFGGARRVAEAVRGADAQALWQIDALWAPFYCPAHWTSEVVYADNYPGWYEHTIGHCPHGHRRTLDDQTASRRADGAPGARGEVRGCPRVVDLPRR